MPNVIEIENLDAPELAAYVRLTEAQLKNRLCPQDGLFIAESPNVIGCALDAGYEPVSLLMERRHIAGKAAALIARCPGIPVYTADTAVLQRLTGYPLTRGVLCAMRRCPLPPLEAVCTDARRVAVLEGVVDATNIGAIFRSAAALGVDAVLLTPTCCDPLNRRAVRVSMGTVFQVPWAWIEAGDWPEASLARLREMGFATAALALADDALAIDDPALKAREKLALVLGAEGDGLAPKTVAACDFTARIPMARGVDSLNVAAAGAVAFWELRARQGREPGGAGNHLLPPARQGREPSAAARPAGPGADSYRSPGGAGSR